MASGVGGKPTIQFSGVNVQLASGVGKEAAINGEGNLIVGYDESPGSQIGSDNLVLGDKQTYLSYGAVLGGEGNTASGEDTDVFGKGNTAGSEWASVSGGSGNIASGGYASVSGGEKNTASGEDSSVSMLGLERDTATYPRANGPLFLGAKKKELSAATALLHSDGHADEAAGVVVGAWLWRELDLPRPPTL